MADWRVLWTRDRASKKRKRWRDGFLSEAPGGARLSLRDEEGKVLGSGSGPRGGDAPAGLEEGEEIERLIDNVVLQIDAACPRAEVPGLGEPGAAAPTLDVAAGGCYAPRPPKVSGPTLEDGQGLSAPGYSSEDLLRCLLVPADKPLPPPTRRGAAPPSGRSSTSGQQAAEAGGPPTAAPGAPLAGAAGSGWGQQRKWQPADLGMGARRTRAAFKAPRPVSGASGGVHPPERHVGAGGARLQQPPASNGPVGAVDGARAALKTLEFAVAPEKPRPPTRAVAVPDAFDDTAQYQRTFGAALVEEMGIRLQPAAKALRQAQLACRPPNGRGPTAGSLREDDFRRLQAAGKQRGLFLYRAEVRAPRKEREGGGVFLGLQDRLPRPSTAYSKGDLWILSNNVGFLDKHAQWVRLVRGVWHGPNPEGVLEVQPFRRVPGLAAGEKKGRLFALHAPGFSSELAMLDNLYRPGVDFSSIGLVQALLRAPGARSSATEAGEQKAPPPGTLGEGLNSSQADVLRRCEAWLDPERAEPPVALVHGPFGSGKSTLLVRIVEALTRDRPSEERLKPLRVMVCANTNIAVDRVLEGLSERPGAPDFLRVGCLRNISTSVLSRSLHAAGAKGGALDELTFMLSECRQQDTARRAQIQAEISLLKQGAEHNCKKQVASVNVLGVTCASCHHEALQNTRFDVLVLDECSQMVEPLSLLPILTAKPRFLVMAGDPKQLPPVLAEASRPGIPRDLRRPLFERLTAIGHEPALLDTQYRCHPAIAGPANRFFYGGRLQDGVSATDRPPLVPGLPPLCFANVPRATQTTLKGFGKSVANRAEAEAVARLVWALSEQGMGLGDIGVICLFRAQAQLVRDRVSQNLMEFDGLTVATVDSFQGQERAVIILTTAVTSQGDFSSDECRTNVALSRAKSHLILVGCAPALQDCPLWGRLLPMCEMCPAELLGDAG